MADETSTKYFVVQRMWNDALKRDVLPGEVVVLDDLSAPAIEKLLALNIIMVQADGARKPNAPAQDLGRTPEQVPGAAAAPATKKSSVKS